MEILKETNDIIVYLNEKGRKCWRFKNRHDIIEAVK